MLHSCVLFFNDCLSLLWGGVIFSFTTVALAFQLAPLHRSDSMWLWYAKLAVIK